MPLDLLLVASANPEDYTNRGRIITPLKDRFGAEVRTHYPIELADELALMRPGGRCCSWARRPCLGQPVVPDHLRRDLARFTRAVREAPQVDQRSGVSARFAIAAVETVAASAVRRAAVTGEPTAVARVVRPAGRDPRDAAARSSSTTPRRAGRIEVLAHLLRRATAETFRARPRRGRPVRPAASEFDEGATVETGELVPAGSSCSRQVGPIPGLAAMLDRLGIGEGSENPGLAAQRCEFALEGLHLSRRLAKDEVPGRDGLRGLSRGRIGSGYPLRAWHGGRIRWSHRSTSAAALDEIGDDVLEGDSPGEALQRLLRRGTDGLRGLDDLRRRVRERQRAARRRGRLDGTLEQVKELLDQALDAERAELFPDPSDAARLAEAELDALPDDPARAVRALTDYDWRSDEAREAYEQIQDLLRREVLDSQFRGMKQALQSANAAGHGAGQGHARRPQPDARGRRPR